MDKKTYLLFVGVALFVAGIGILISPQYKSTASEFEKTIITKASRKYGALYVLRNSVGSKIELGNGRYYALVLNGDFIQSVTPRVISIDNKIIPVSNQIVYVDDSFLRTGEGYIAYKLTLVNGQCEIIARATLVGNEVKVEPLYGVLFEDSTKLYLVQIPGTGFSFKSYKRLTVEIRGFFADGKPIDPPSGRPLDIIS